MCREREITVIGSQGKFQEEPRQKHLLTNARLRVTQHEEASITKHKNNGGGDMPLVSPSLPPVSSPPEIPRLTFIETLTVSASASTIAQTVHEFYLESKKKDSKITISRAGQTLDLEGKLIEEIQMFLKQKEE
jgi:hypothetical protein